MKHFWFGDSWVEGAELANSDDAFPKIVSEESGAECVNLGQSASSIDEMSYHFFQNYQSMGKKDVVFFCLTVPHRTSIFENGRLKRLTPQYIYKQHHPHPYNTQWYKYFDNEEQRLYNRDRTIDLLYFWTQSLGVKCWFANIWSVDTDHVMDVTPESSWLIPRNDCLASAILPIIHKDNLHMSDNPDLTNEQWLLQQSAIDEFIKPNWAHPNEIGHRQIANKILAALARHA